MPNLFDIAPFISLLDAGETIVTANSRQCAKMRAAYCHVKQQEKAVCQAPKLFSFNSWVDSIWQSNSAQLSQSVVLNTLQRLWLWQRIIDRDLDSLALVKTEQLYTHADTAYRNLHLWQANVDSWTNHDPVHGVFRQWLDQFQGTLEASHWIIPEQRQSIVLAGFNDNKLPRYQRLHIYGFDDIPPLTLSLLTSSTDALLQHHSTEQPHNQCSHQTWPKQGDEISAAANWARNILTDNEHASIGIISPNLGQIRDDIEQILTETFELESFNVSQPRYTLPFNFSAGIPLAHAPVVDDAFAILKLLSSNITFETACNLLLSPFWIFGKHHRLSQKLVQQLSLNPRSMVAAADLRHRLTGEDEHPILTKLLNVNEQLRRLPKQLPASQWMDVILDLLTTLEWPGDRRLDSVEYQQVVQLHKLIEQFTGLDVVQRELSFSKMLTTLIQLAQRTPFQAQTPESPIQVLGALEGAALNFDYCWVLGCDNQSWPPPASPNPLIPIDLQRALDMPNSSADKQLRYAQSLTTKLMHCATTVIFSCSEYDGESELSPSSLIAELPSAQFLSLRSPRVDMDGNQDQGVLWQTFQQNLFQQRQWSWVDCEYAPALAEWENLRGGTSILKWQAAHPYNAFCRYRLNVYPLPTIEHHLPATIRGDITHLALANFWRETGSQSQLQLQQLTESELSEGIDKVVGAAVNHYSSYTDTLTPERRSLEQERQSILLNAWLNYEKQRPDFTVCATEQSFDAEIEGLTFKLQIDRIDHCAGEKIIIDYKSGLGSSTGQLKPSRLIAPQLPLYACYWQQKVAAVAYAIINNQSIKLDGIGVLTEMPQGIKTAEKAFEQSWDQLKRSWQQDLRATALEFKTGVVLNHVYDRTSEPFQVEYLAVNRILEKAENYQLWREDQFHDA